MNKLSSRTPCDWESQYRLCANPDITAVIMASAGFVLASREVHVTRVASERPL